MTYTFKQMGTYEYILECLRYFNKSHYCQVIEESLVVDEVIYKMGFSKYPIYKIEIDISQEDIVEIRDIVESYRKTDFFGKYNDYIDFYHIISDYGKLG